MERVVFDRMAELDQHHWWFVARRRILAEVIRRVVEPRRRRCVLEVGCGTGHNLQMLGKFGKRRCVRAGRDRARLASDRLGRPVLRGAAARPHDVRDEVYDLVALLDVLEHVPDDAGSLKAITKLLKPGGALLLTVPANKWMWSAHDVAHHHFRRYTKRELARLFSGAGSSCSCTAISTACCFRRSPRRGYSGRSAEARARTMQCRAPGSTACWSAPSVSKRP